MRFTISVLNMLTKSTCVNGMASAIHHALSPARFGNVRCCPISYAVKPLNEAEFQCKSFYFFFRQNLVVCGDWKIFFGNDCALLAVRHIIHIFKYILISTCRTVLYVWSGTELDFNKCAFEIVRSLSPPVRLSRVYVACIQRKMSMWHTYLRTLNEQSD